VSLAAMNRPRPRSVIGGSSCPSVYICCRSESVIVKLLNIRKYHIQKATNHSRVAVS
jgi:hypothetical protein